MTNTHPHNRYRSALHFLTLAVLIPLLGVTLFAYLQLRSSLQAQAYLDLDTAVSGHIGALRDNLALVESYALHLDTDSPDSERHPRMRKLTDSIVRIDQQSTSLLAGTAIPREILRHLSHKALEAKAQTLLRPPGTDALFLLIPVTAAGAEHALVAHLNVGGLLSTPGSSALPTSLCLFEKLVALYCSPDLQSPSHAADTALISDTSLGHGTWHYNLPDEEEHVYLTQRATVPLTDALRSEPLTIIALRSKTAALAPLTPPLWLFPGMLTITSLGILLPLLWRARQHRDSLDAIQTLSESITDGHFGVTLDDPNRDLSELNSSLNEMSRALEARFNSLNVLSEIDSMLLSFPDRVRVTSAVVERLPSIFPARKAGILVIDQDNQQRGQLIARRDGDEQTTTTTRLRIETAFQKRMKTSSGAEPQAIGAYEKIDCLSDCYVDDSDVVHVYPLIHDDTLQGALCLTLANNEGLDEHQAMLADSIAQRLNIALSAVESQRKLYEQAHFDDLTGLPNRALFLDRLNQSLIHAQRNNNKVAVLYADLDRFKAINDSLGHRVGDLALQEVAKRLQGCLRESDSVARLSGDEFIFALPGLTDTRDVIKVADTITAAFKAPLDIEQQQFAIDLSIGIAIYPEDGANADTLLKHSDIAMYRAKSNSATQFLFFEEQMNRDIFERTELGKALGQALANGELHLRYQPKVNASDYRIASAEALLRWEHPEKGQISPATFIPIAEELGMMRDIGEFVLREACTQLVAWRNAGLTIDQIAVNVSPRQIRYTDLVAGVENVLSQTGLPASALELDITENLLLDDYEKTQETLSELESLGVELALDDFGTGHSSLGHVHELAFSTLKIDSCFVAALPGDETAKAIVDSIVAMGKSLGKTLVAEGVETAEQLAYLTTKGCHSLQGYYFSEPLTVKQMTELLENDEALGNSAPVAVIHRR